MEQTRPLVQAEIDEIPVAPPATGEIAELTRDAGGLPTMTVQVPQKAEPEKPIVTVDEMQAFLKEAVTMVRDDRAETSEYIKNFADMILNEGDASGPTKEAFVQLVKMKQDAATNLTKLIELMMRPLLKQSSESKPWLNATQHNEIKISPRRKLVEKYARKAEEKKGK